MRLLPGYATTMAQKAMDIRYGLVKMFRVFFISKGGKVKCIKHSNGKWFHCL